MLRDYRDVCVSLAFHAYRQTETWEGHFMDSNLKYLDNNFLREHLLNYESHADFEKYSMFASKLPEQICIVRYEDLTKDPEKILNRIFEFLEIPKTTYLTRYCIRKNSFEKLSGGRKPGQSESTSFFRKGIIGDWQNHFSEENIKTFKEISGPTLIAAGYEKDNNWGL
jgi:hypothetical protein